MPTWWERIAYQIARAVVAAIFDEMRDRGLAEREVPDATQLAVRDRFRTLVARVSEAGRDPGSVGPAPDRQSDGRDGVVRSP